MWPFKKKKWSGGGFDLAVVGLGNPGPEYVGTRHNVGFDCVDKFASEHGLKWTGRRGPLKWAEGRVTIEGSAKRILLAKPRTFMNLSGEAVRYITTRWSVPEDQPGDHLRRHGSALRHYPNPYARECRGP